MIMREQLRNVDCGEACKARKADLEREIRATRRDLKAKEELTSVYEEQLRQLREFKDNNDLQVGNFFIFVLPHCSLPSSTCV